MGTHNKGKPMSFIETLIWFEDHHEMAKHLDADMIWWLAVHDM